MASPRRELFQSYQFMVQRVISGVVLRETDPIQTPLRKMTGSGFASIMVAIVALAGSALIGIFFPSGNTSWQEGGKVIVEEESGATFVWLPDEDNNFALYPTPNYTSAALLAGTREIVSVSAASLVGAPRGPQRGILDAPGALPVPERMLTGPWTLCSLPAETRAGARVPNTALVVGRDISEGAKISDQAVLARDVELGGLYLVWHGHQFPIRDEEVVREALILQTETVVEVGTAWLNALPAGRDLGPEPVAGRGLLSTVIPDAIVGEVRVVVAGGNRQYYQVGATQIIEITEVQAQILLADREIRATVYAGAAPVPRPLSADVASELSDTLRVDLPDPLPTDPPAGTPEMATFDGPNPTICASFSDDQPTPGISVEAGVEGAAAANATPQQTESGTVLADRVLVAPGYGAIVEERASASAQSGTLYLITDEGRRYPITPDVQGMLGYGQVTPLALPASLIARIPAGSALDPVAAQQAVA